MYVWMDVCMYVCMYVFMYVCMDVCIYVSVCLCVCVCVCVWVFGVCVCVCMCDTYFWMKYPTSLASTKRPTWYKKKIQKRWDVSKTTICIFLGPKKISRIFQLIKKTIFFKAGKTSCQIFDTGQWRVLQNLGFSRKLPEKRNFDKLKCFFFLVNPFLPTGQFMVPKWIILIKCLIDILISKCCFNVCLCRTRCEFGIAIMFRS